MKNFLNIALKEEQLGIKPDWESIFGRSAPLYLEIGIGNGEFIVWLAKNNPDSNFVGIEVSREYFKKAINRAIASGVTNLRLIRIEGAKALSKLFDSESLSGLYLNFPDPWARKGRQERRLVNSGFVWLLADRLVLNGFFLMVTDYKPYAEEVLQFFSECPAFTLLWKEPMKQELPGYYKTKYARKWLSMGLPIFYIGFKKIKRVELPEWVCKLYPLIKLDKEGSLPLNILKVKEKIDVKQLKKAFSKEILWKKEKELIKILDIYFKEDAMLLDTLVVEGYLRQRFFVVINFYDKDKIIIKIHDSESPDLTDGVQRALVLITLKLKEIFSEAELVQSSCKAKIFKEVKKAKGLE